MSRPYSTPRWHETSFEERVTDSLPPSDAVTTIATSMTEPIHPWFLTTVAAPLPCCVLLYVLVPPQAHTEKENWLKFYVNPYSGMAEAEVTEPVALNQANLEVRATAKRVRLFC